MKIFLVFIVIAFAELNFTEAQDAKFVLQQSQHKVNDLNTCSYLLYSKTKVTGMRDTLYQTGRCTFIKIEKDTILGRHIFIDNFSGIKEMYDGTTYMKSRRTDSIVFIWDVHRFNFFKHQFATNPLAYSPLLNKKNIYSQLLNDRESSLTLLTDTMISEALCYHIKTFTHKLKDTMETGITIECDLFIRKYDFMPLGHVQNLQSNINKVINNYESVFLEDLEINKMVDENIFSFSGVPDNYTFKQEGIINIKNYIVPNEQVPDFDYNYIKSDSLYKTVKGKNVLLAVIVPDNCLPCGLTKDMINIIYQENKKRNLTVLIVSSEGLSAGSNRDLINDQNSTFPSLSSGQQIIDKTHINVFPTIYLFNKKGEQVYKNEGFNNRMKDEIEKEIDALPLN